MIQEFSHKKKMIISLYIGKKSLFDYITIYLILLSLIILLN